MARTSITSYRDLEVWQKSMELAVRCYSVTRMFPANEAFGLTNQLRRAVTSIPSNIAEGHRVGRRAFIAHVRVAAGSHAEVETQLELAQRLGYLSADTAREVKGEADAVGRLLNGLLRSLSRPPVASAGACR